MAACVIMCISYLIS